MCGTNFAALALPVTYLLDTVWPVLTGPWAPAVVAVLSLALTMELWQVVQDPAGASCGRCSFPAWHCSE